MKHNEEDDIVAALVQSTPPLSMTGPMLLSMSEPKSLPVPEPVPAPRRRYGQRWRLGNSLAMCRAVGGMTQAQLAATVGVSRRTISGIENCKHEPAVSLALAIAEALNRPVEQLFSLHRR